MTLVSSCILLSSISLNYCLVGCSWHSMIFQFIQNSCSNLWYGYEKLYSLKQGPRVTWVSCNSARLTRKVVIIFARCVWWRWVSIHYAGGVLLQDLMRSRSREIQVLPFPIALKCDRILRSRAAEILAKFQSDTINITSNFAAERSKMVLLCVDILYNSVPWYINTIRIEIRHLFYAVKLIRTKFYVLSFRNWRITDRWNKCKHLAHFSCAQNKYHVVGVNWSLWIIIVCHYFRTIDKT